jgi:hypothetical protein
LTRGHSKGWADQVVAAPAMKLSRSISFSAQGKSSGSSKLISCSPQWRTNSPPLEPAGRSLDASTRLAAPAVSPRGVAFGPAGFSTLAIDFRKF